MQKIIFFGTSDFSAIILKKLIQSPYKPIICVTQIDKKVGRKQIITSPLVKKISLINKIPVLQFTKLDNEAVLKIKKLKPDLIIVAAYGKILPEEILKLPRFYCINIHPSLLPKYRGPSPIQTAILNGEKDTGVTIIKLTSKMDAGPILAQIKQKIYNYDTNETLHRKLAEEGATLLLMILPKIFTNKIKLIPQDELKATYTKILKKEDGKINWQNSAEDIERQIRAFVPWPGSYSYFQKNNQKLLIKIKKASVLNFKNRMLKDFKPGELLNINDQKLVIFCGKGNLILEKVHVEGKKEITGSEFLRGYPEVQYLF